MIRVLIIALISEMFLISISGFSQDYGNQNGVSFYAFDKLGLNAPISGRSQNVVTSGSIAFKNGNIIVINNVYSESRKNQSFLYSYGNKMFNPYYFKGLNSFTAGCEITENKFAVGASSNYTLYEVADKKLTVAATHEFSEPGYSCKEMYYAGNNQVISLWKNEKIYILQTWNYKTNYTASYTFNNVWNGCINLAVSLDNKFAAVVASQGSETVKIIGIDLLAGINSKKITPKFTFEKEYANIGIYGAKISNNGHLIAYLSGEKRNKYGADVKHIYLCKFNQNGDLKQEIETKALDSKLWTRTDAKKLDVSGSNSYIYFKPSTIQFIQDLRTGKIYVLSRMQPKALTYSYGPNKEQIRDGRTASDMPFLIALNTETLKWDGFDFIETITNGKLHKVYGEGRPGKLSFKPAVISSTPEKTKLILPEISSNKYTFLWEAIFQKIGSGGVTSNSTLANDNSSNQGNTLSNITTSDKNKTTEQKQNTEPQFSGTVSIKNDTEDQVYCWISTGGSGWISKGGSKAFRCQKGAKVYLSNSNSSSTKKLAFETTVDQCGKTIKVSSVR